MTNFSVLNYWRSHRHFKVAAVVLIVIGLTWTAEGYRRLCYHCNTTIHGTDCLDNPNNVTNGEISCKGFCTIKRKEYNSLPEDFSFISLERSCQVAPIFYDEMVVESYFKTYFRTCKNYLCNGGSGKESLKDIPVDPAWDMYSDYPDSNASFHLKPITILYLSSLSILLTMLQLFGT